MTIKDIKNAVKELEKLFLEDEEGLFDFPYASFFISSRNTSCTILMNNLSLGDGCIQVSLIARNHNLAVKKEGLKNIEQKFVIPFSDVSKVENGMVYFVHNGVAGLLHS